MRSRVENASVLILLAFAAFTLIKLIIFVIGFFSNVGIDATSMASSLA
ncbi:hypothetical protein [Hanstruepera neustonica]|nr:hypothetical protein [Hanstruepera neustonica]